MKERVWFGFAVILAIGCGGGGGGVTTTTGGRVLGDICPPATGSGTLVYRTTWGNAPATASQILQFIDGNGVVIRTDSLNRNGDTESEYVASSVTAGVYEVRARLYSQPNAGGSPTAETSQVIDLCGGSASLSTSVSTPATQFVATPSSLALKTGNRRRLVSRAVDAGGRGRFIGIGAVTYSVNGPAVTVDSQGVVEGVAVGSATVTANWTAGSQSADVPVTVTQTVVQRTKWTVLVYLNAANDLFRASDLNVNQMESVANNPNVRFVVQWKQSKNNFASSSFDGVRRYLVTYDTTSNIASQLVQGNLTDGVGNPLDMGDPQTLNDFVVWGKANYPADRYCLIIWNHGNGWKRGVDESYPTRGFSYDDESQNSIQTWEIDQALAGQTFDILAWDASLMQMTEVAYEARNHATFIVGSEESPPADGYPYDLVFAPWAANPDDTTFNLATKFVDGMLNYGPYATRKITQSVVESNKLPALATAVDTLALQLIANRSSLLTIWPQIRNQAQAYSDTPTRTYRDLIHICQLLNSNAGTPQSVKTAATNVIAAATTAIVDEGHNSNSSLSNGLAIDDSSASLFASLGSDYRMLKFANDTNWDEWLAQAP
ncbi:MAG: Ig-like domain-containing protein [Fimbriimonadaceae bacterium]|nr:Ig-like domain-containing protein [Fimbriimonadaceae bacterium]